MTVAPQSPGVMPLALPEQERFSSIVYQLSSVARHCGRLSIVYRRSFISA
jgi:hypothetical protein